MKSSSMRVWLLLSAVALSGLACGSGKSRSLLLVNVEAPAELVGIDNVSVEVSGDAGDLARQTFAWNAAPGSALEIGIYVPSSVNGTVRVRADAYNNLGTFIGSSE